MTRTTTLSAALIAAAAFTSAVYAQTDGGAGRIKAHVTFLADDLLEGRETGTRGHEIAALYVATQFELMGVKPGSRRGSYFQTVDLLEAVQTGAQPTFVVTTPRGRQVMPHGGTVIIRGSILGGAAKLHAPLVFIGYGMVDEAIGYDDYQGLDVRGKIVVALAGSPKGMDSEIGAYLWDQQSRFAAEHGAVAIVSVPTRANASAFPWTNRLRSLDHPRTTWVRDDGTPFDPGYGLEASAVIDTPAAAVLFEGASATLAQVLDEADKVGGRPKGFALEAAAKITVATTTRRYASPEVVGLIEGADPELKSEYVVLMAHADHLGVKAGAVGDGIHNGALDNAAGVAILLEVARELASAAERPRRSILVVASTGEEKGLLGAEHFAHHPAVPIERVTAAIDLDMPMLLYDFTDVVAYGADHSTLSDAIREAGAAIGVKLSPDPMPEQAIFVRSDNYPMAKVGVPAVLLATGMANGGGAAWGKYLSGVYHKPSDDLSQPILWSAGAKFAELNYRIVRALADTGARAQWYAGDYFGDRFAAAAPKAGKPAGR